MAEGGIAARRVGLVGRPRAPGSWPEGGLGVALDGHGVPVVAAELRRVDVQLDDRVDGGGTRHLWVSWLPVWLPTNSARSASTPWVGAGSGVTPATDGGVVAAA